MKVKIQMTLKPSELSEEDIRQLTDRKAVVSQYGASAKASVKKNKQGDYVVAVQYEAKL